MAESELIFCFLPSIYIFNQNPEVNFLALPPHGSEVFIGGLPREVTEEDLRDLCDAIGDILEVRIMSCCACDI